MKLLNYTIKIIIALYLAKYVSELVIHENYIMFYAIVSGVLFLFSPWKYKFTLFSISAFYPFFIPGGFIVINSPDWIMIIAPITCLIFIVELAIDKQPMFSRKAFIFFAAVGVIALWAVVNYIKNPVLGKQFSGASAEQGGIKSYFILFVGVTTFLCSYWFSRYKKIDFNKWMTIILYLSFFIGILRIFSYFYNFYIPLLGGTYKYLFFWQLGEGEPYRIGGLSEAATIGISSLIGLFYKREWNTQAILLFAGFLIMLILSGGRGTFIGVVLALMLYVSLINRKYFLPLLLSVLLFAGIYTLFFINAQLGQTKIGRVLAYSDKDVEGQESRLIDARIFYEYFLENPVFGKGIGYDVSKFKDVKLEGAFQDVAIGNVIHGGHGAYMSIMGLFGIGGIFYFSVMLFGSIYYAYKIVKRNLHYRPDDVKLAVFAFILLITLAFTYVPGGDGYGDMTLWFLAGMIAGILAKDGDDKCLITINK